MCELLTTHNIVWIIIIEDKTEMAVLASILENLGNLREAGHEKSKQWDLYLKVPPPNMTGV